MNEYTFRIKRFNPERDKRPRWEEFSLRMERTQQILDGLIKIKEALDGTLTFRRSCAHGICGSCAIKINGENGLACQTLMKDMPEMIHLEPLQSFPVIKDLVVDLEAFFEKNGAVLPFLVNNDPLPERERLQMPKDQIEILQATTCIMCGCCTSSCPVSWTDSGYLGPSALLRAYRFIFDSRDRSRDKRLKRIMRSDGIWRCHSINNCVEACPKEIAITDHITKLKRLALKRTLLRK